ncbi:hypothetical protein JCM19296_250 [Nonlabens ulvanivorans]|uniref:Uncharacterized protein n=1 Tax=Nonlabens ulvanivorans TaxID=906888 RepID=A0A081D6X6_NONUL|nr:hypothetical protein JCM19296_250 [Nonlabens ulvanivorans]
MTSSFSHEVTAIKVNKSKPIMVKIEEFFLNIHNKFNSNQGFDTI